MNKQMGNMNAVLIVIVCTLVIFSGIDIAYGQDFSKAESLVNAESVESAGSAGEETYVKTVAYTSENLRDPFEGYIQKAAAPLTASQLAQEENFVPPPLAISGITWGSSFPQAIVNGKVIKAGDVIGEVQILSISKEGLICLYKKQQFSVPAPGAANTSQTGKKTP